jgi:predicted small lipoprotein YifL
VTGARGRGRRRAAHVVAAVAAALAVTLPACGKKAPPRLPDQRAAEKAATPRASVREGRLTLEFAVPAHRIFPEREDPWVLARILRQDPPAKDFVEVGAILEGDGFAFEAPLTWSEAARTAGSSAYRVEFRDGARRRRALSDPVTISWLEAPAAPGGLVAAGDDRGVALTWTAPAGSAGARYRVYRREAPDGPVENLTPEPLAVPGHADSRIRPSREYCYQVRAVLGEAASAVEGPPSAETCVRTEDATPPPPPEAVQVTATPGGFQVSWRDVSAPDLLGYRVYRAIEDGPLELLTPAPIGGNAYREETPDARAGARYRYVVTAVDAAKRANESPFSPAAEAAAIPPAGAP